MNFTEIMNLVATELEKMETPQETEVRKSREKARFAHAKKEHEAFLAESNAFINAIEAEEKEEPISVEEFDELELSNILKSVKVKLTKEERMEKNTIVTGFTPMTNSLMRELIKNVGGDGYAIYSIILSHRNNKSGECFLSYEQIKYETGFSLSKVKRNMQKLLGAGYVKRINNPVPGVASEFEFPLENFKDKTITKQEAEMDIALGVVSNKSILDELNNIDEDIIKFSCVTEEDEKLKHSRARIYKITARESAPYNKFTLEDFNELQNLNAELSKLGAKKMEELKIWKWQDLMNRYIGKTNDEDNIDFVNIIDNIYNKKGIHELPLINYLKEAC